MPESFDNQLSNKIRSTFDNYKEPFNNDAWELMQQKLTKNNRKSFIWFIDITKAASIILFVGIGVLWPFKTNHPFSENKEFDFNNGSFSNKKTIVNKNKELIIEEENTDFNFENKVKQEKIIQGNVNKDFYISNNENNKKFSKNIVDSIKNEINQEKKIFADNIIIEEKDSVNNQPKKDTIKDNRPILIPDDKDFFIEKKSDKKFNFGIAVSSHYSSSEIGATDNINIGGGFLTEYKISDKISINSGLLIANHHMNTGSSNILGGLTKSDAVENTFAGSSETEVLLIGLDIPLNIQFNMKKMYISTGISSLVYLKESYSNSYYVENTQDVYNSETNSYEILYLYDQVSENQESGAFQTFDFAKLFNFSVGYKIPLKKGSLIFEPYAKIPIGNLTSYNISYGYGGLALKYDF